VGSSGGRITSSTTPGVRDVGPYVNAQRFQSKYKYIER
jgi:hypothetical protein